MCNGNCNQGRSCDCAPERQRVDVAGWLFAMVVAAMLMVGILLIILVGMLVGLFIRIFNAPVRIGAWLRRRWA